MEKHRRYRVNNITIDGRPTQLLLWLQHSMPQLKLPPEFHLHPPIQKSEPRFHLPPHNRLPGGKGNAHLQLKHDILPGAHHDQLNDHLWLQQQTGGIGKVPAKKQRRCSEDTTVPQRMEQFDQNWQSGLPYGCRGNVHVCHPLHGG